MVLIVDDDPVVRATISNMLEASGFEVTTCEHGAGALGALEHGVAADVMLSDEWLPGDLSGWNVARRPATIAAGIATILISGTVDIADPRGDDAPVVPVFSNPFRLAESVEHITDALRRSPSGHHGETPPQRPSRRGAGVDLGWEVPLRTPGSRHRATDRVDSARSVESRPLASSRWRSTAGAVHATRRPGTNARGATESRRGDRLRRRIRSGSPAGLASRSWRRAHRLAGDAATGHHRSTMGAGHTTGSATLALGRERTGHRCGGTGDFDGAEVT